MIRFCVIVFSVPDTSGTGIISAMKSCFFGGLNPIACRLTLGFQQANTMKKHKSTDFRSFGTYGYCIQDDILIDMAIGIGQMRACIEERFSALDTSMFCYGQKIDPYYRLSLLLVMMPI